MTTPTRRGPVVTEADLQILALVAAGRTARQIGREVGRTTKGIHTHLSRLYVRMGVRNAPHAVATAMRAGLLPVPDRAARR